MNPVLPISASGSPTDTSENVNCGSPRFVAPTQCAKCDPSGPGQTTAHHERSYQGSEPVHVQNLAAKSIVGPYCAMRNVRQLDPFRGRTDARIDHHDMDRPGGKPRPCLAEHEGTPQQVGRLNLMCDVHDLGLRRDGEDDYLYRGQLVVMYPDVSCQCYHRHLGSL